LVVFGAFLLLVATVPHVTGRMPSRRIEQCSLQSTAIHDLQEQTRLPSRIRDLDSAG
jgi:hypothetical protein